MKREEDRIIWSGDSEGSLFIRGLYSILQVHYTNFLPLRMIWNGWIPLKVRFFMLEKGIDFGFPSKKRVGVGEQECIM